MAIQRISAAEARALLKAQSGRRHKFGAIPTEMDGFRFDSKGEATRWAWLKLMQRSGEIRDLDRQIDFELHVCNLETGELTTIGLVCIDFTYTDVRSGERVVEDWKGMATLPIAKWKYKHLKAEYGITVIEQRKPLRR